MKWVIRMTGPARNAAQMTASRTVAADVDRERRARRRRRRPPAAEAVRRRGIVVARVTLAHVRYGPRYRRGEADDPHDDGGGPERDHVGDVGVAAGRVDPSHAQNSAIDAMISVAGGDDQDEAGQGVEDRAVGVAAPGEVEPDEIGVLDGDPADEQAKRR